MSQMSLFGKIHSSADPALQRPCAAADAFQPGDIIASNDGAFTYVIMGMTHAWNAVGHKYYAVTKDRFDRGDVTDVHEIHGRKSYFDKIGRV